MRPPARVAEPRATSALRLGSANSRRIRTWVPSEQTMKTTNRFSTAAFALSGILLLAPTRLVNAHAPAFQIEEATIETIQAAIRRKEVTSTGVVELYLARIKAYNGTCVNQP